MDIRTFKGTLIGHVYIRMLFFYIDFLCIYGNGHQDIKRTSMKHVYKRMLLFSHRLPIYLWKGTSEHKTDMYATCVQTDAVCFIKTSYVFMERDIWDIAGSLRKTNDVKFPLTRYVTHVGVIRDIKGTYQGHRWDYA